MGTFRISDQALKAMPESRRSEALEKLVRSAQQRPNGELKEVRTKIEDYERSFGISSETMLAELSSGARRETLETCEWLMLLKRRSRLERAART